MKILILFWSLIKKNILPIFITMLMLTISMFIMATFYGQYKYAAYTRDVLLASDLQDSVYFMINMDGDPEIDYETSNNIKETVLQFDGCSGVLFHHSFNTAYSERILNVCLYDRQMRQNFKLDVKKGRWLSKDPDKTEAVIGGSIWGDIKLGDIITLENGISAEIVGIMGDTVIFPNFSSSSNTGISADQLFESNNTMVFITEETIPSDVYDDLYLNQDVNFFTVFSENATEKQRDEIITFLKNNGSVDTYDEIIENSNARLKEWVSGAFPLPMFLIIISTLNIICICAVIVKRSMADYSKYYLMGCSKRKGLLLITLPLAALFSVPYIVNIISVTFFPDFLRAGRRVGMIDYILNIKSAMPIIVYLLFIISVLTLMPLMFYRKHSPLSFYRRNL